MYNFERSMELVESNIGISRINQIKAMQKCVSLGMRPFDYFDNAIYLHRNNDPTSYLGIQQVKGLWDRYSAAASVVTLDQRSINLETVLDSKSLTKKWLNGNYIQTPYTMKARYFVDAKIPFVIKPDKGYGGKDVRIFLYDNDKGMYTDHAREPINYLDKIYDQDAEAYIQPITPSNSDTYRIHTHRIMVFTKKNVAKTVAVIARYKHKLHAADNFSLNYNAVTGFPNIGTRSTPVQVVKGVEGPPMPMYLPSVYSDFAGLRKSLEILCAEAVHSWMGTFIGFDVIHGDRGWFVLEANHRPGFRILQVAHRKGAKELLEGIL